jgi:site-specific recombinase XerC
MDDAAQDPTDLDPDGTRATPRPAASGPPALPPPAPASDAPHGARPDTVRAWFDAATEAEIPTPDGTLATAQIIAEVLARRAKSDNTRRAYRAGVRAWCAWCETHALAPLPARPADVAAFLAAQRYVSADSEEKPLAANTLKLRLAAIAYLHYLAGLPSPTTTAVVTETFAGLHRIAAESGNAPRQKLAARIAVLREIVAAIPDDLPGLRDRALLLVGFAGAFRRSELARIAVEHIEHCEHGLRIILRVSKGDRARKGVQVGIPYGTSELCAVRAVARWRAAAGITTGPLFRRIWTTPRPKEPPPGGTPTYVVGRQALDPGTVARIVKARGAAAGFDRAALGGHSLKRGALNTAQDLRVHPARLKQLGRHRSYAPLAAYIEEGDLFEDNALNGVL